tara:strand:- start:9162 stop:11462 length:2301 start_codon:yes stop_codon:yes gene_type:complete
LTFILLICFARSGVVQDATGADASTQLVSTVDSTDVPADIRTDIRPESDAADGSASPVSFTNDVVPVLTKAGCNAGVCHAKANGGRNGFQLSLLGFEPQEDYDHIVLEARGRRIFPAAAEESLLLIKATGKQSHGGGVRIEHGSDEYHLIRRWIQQGAPPRIENEPELLSIRVRPKQGVMRPGQRKTLRATALYSDGTKRDVTRMAIFESNDQAMIEVDQAGVATAQDIPGKASVMVRYQGKTSVFSAAIPLSQEQFELPAEKNFVDKFVFSNLKTLGIPPSPICDDSVFLRRVTLDIAGRIPTTEETESFLHDTRPDRRDRMIQSLLDGPGYADYFANKWTALLKNRRDSGTDILSNFAFHAWIRDSLLANRPYDQIVRELLASTGTVLDNPPVAWYKRVTDPKQQIEDVAQLFLGVRMQCAQCHHHPFERWSQGDYYSLTAFFSQVGRKPTTVRGEDLIFHERGIAFAENVKTGQKLSPMALGDSVGEIAADVDPRLVLADWMSSKDNPFFAKALVNRYWKHFFARGLVEPEDDLRDTNPPTNPELLAALEKHFVDSGFDLKDLVRVITQSNAYQLSSIPNDANLADRQNYSRFYPRRMQAEVLLDSIDDVAGSRTSFADLPLGTRAVALPDNSYNASSDFLRVFGRPESSSVCECERVQSANLGQSLHFLNAKEIQDKLVAPKGRLQTLLDSCESSEERVTQIYLAALSRSPTADELGTATAYLQQSRVDEDGKSIDPQSAEKESLQDLLWAIINTKEFLFNH